MNIFSFIPEKWRPNRKVTVGVVTGLVLSAIAAGTGVSAESLLGVEGMNASVTLIVSYVVAYWVPA